MRAHGRCRTGTGHIREDPEQLKGVLASEHEEKVYPSNVCPACVARGIDDDRCFRHHWETPEDHQGGYEIR